ncbi:MAG: hypothetical protein U1E36_05605 [Rickettsiales bacterium]
MNSDVVPVARPGSNGFGTASMQREVSPDLALPALTRQVAWDKFLNVPIKPYPALLRDR